MFTKYNCQNKHAQFRAPEYVPVHVFPENTHPCAHYINGKRACLEGLLFLLARNREMEE